MPLLNIPAPILMVSNNRSIEGKWAPSASDFAVSLVFQYFAHIIQSEYLGSPQTQSDGEAIE